MFKNLEVMQMAHSMASHASARQTVIAQNVANADTPGFRARDTVSFAESYGTNSGDMRATREGHLQVAQGDVPIFASAIGGRESPNGNTVSVEAEMMKASETRHQHEVALSVYKTSLDILRTSVGRR